jgi:transposase-like protein
MKKVCPKCGSTKVDIDSGVYTMGILPTRFVCSDCSYAGNFFPEVDESDVAKFRAKLKKLAKLDEI